MDIAFFPGCLTDMFFPNVGKDATEVLERLGCKIRLPKKQVCCGQMLLNSGYAKENIPVAKNMIDAYYGYKTIVSLTGSCMYAVLYDYPEFMQDEPEYLEKIYEMRKHFYEFTQFIVHVLGKKDVGAKFKHTVTYHQSCHLSRLLGVVDEPLTLLNNVKGLKYIEMEHKDRCCGFGGTFSVKQPEISDAIVSEKVQTILDTGAEVVCGADMPCLMNIKGKIDRLRDSGDLDHDVKVMHIAQILNSGVK
ncbi:MAG: (Fe-S)-binding protein [Coriobacteriales bacterium]|nr:(Fe-S)-binding protein [Coriobacteriales bacterium]